MREIIPTIVPEVFQDVLDARKRYAFASSIHIDAVDGTFAPGKTWLPLGGERLLDAKTTCYEAHLMIENPLSMGLAFVRTGVRRIIGHVEAFNHCEHAQETMDMWQKAGADDVGVAILMDTPLSELSPYVSLIDTVLVMTIAKIGKQGAPFDERAIARISEIRERFPKLTIAVDGGVSKANIESLTEAGATRFCVGSALTKSKDPERLFTELCGEAVY